MKNVNPCESTNIQPLTVVNIVNPDDGSRKSPSINEIMNGTMPNK